LGVGGWNCGLVVTGALECNEPEAPSSIARLRPFATACRLFWFSWVRASLTNSLYVAHLALAIVFIYLVPMPLLKLSIFLFCIHECWCISGQVVECMHILGESLCSLCQLHKLSSLHPHQPRGYMMPPKGCLELFPGDIYTSR